MALNFKPHAEVLSEMLQEQARSHIEEKLQKEIDGIREKFDQILLEERLRLMKDLQFTIRHDFISDRMVMTLEVKTRESIESERKK